MSFRHLQHQLRIIKRATHIFWQIRLNYRLGAFIWIINGFITPLILMSIWLTAGQHRELAATNSQIITYYLLLIIVTRITQSWTGESLGQKINRGLFSVYLVKPTSYLTFELARDFAGKITRFISLSPFLVIALLLFNKHLIIGSNLLEQILFITSLFFGYSINFLFQNIIGLIALWTEKSQGLYQIFEYSQALFNGYLIPLTLMPPLLQRLTILLPFHYYLGFPINLLSGTLSTEQILTQLTAMVMWNITLSLVFIAVYKSGIKKYSAVGN